MFEDTKSIQEIHMCQMMFKDLVDIGTQDMFKQTNKTVKIYINETTYNTLIERGDSQIEDLETSFTCY